MVTAKTGQVWRGRAHQAELHGTGQAQRHGPARREQAKGLPGEALSRSQNLYTIRHNPVFSLTLHGPPRITKIFVRNRGYSTPAMAYTPRH